MENRTEWFVRRVSDATQQYIEGAITGIEYLSFVAQQCCLFDERFKEPESFKKAGV